MRLRTTRQLLSLFSPFPKRSEETPSENNVLPASCHWWCLPSELRTPRHAGNAEDPAWNNLGAPPCTHVHTSQSWLSTTQHRRMLTLHLLYPSSCPCGPVDHLHPTTERGQWAEAHSPLARFKKHFFGGFLAMLCDLRDLSSPSRDQTWATALKVWKRQVLTTRPPGNSQENTLKPQTVTQAQRGFRFWMSFESSRGVQTVRQDKVLCRVRNRQGSERGQVWPGPESFWGLGMEMGARACHHHHLQHRWIFTALSPGLPAVPFLQLTYQRPGV